MQRTFQLPRTCEVFVKFLGSLQRIRKQNCERPGRLACVRAMARFPSPSVIQLVSPWAMTADLMNTLRICVEVNSRSCMDLTISRPGIVYVRCTSPKEQYERCTTLANNSNLFSSQLAVRVESGDRSSNRVISLCSLARDNSVERSGRSKGPNHGSGGS